MIRRFSIFTDRCITSYQHKGVLENLKVIQMYHSLMTSRWPEYMRAQSLGGPKISMRKIKQNMNFLRSNNG
jgi:hypothetical protein